MNPDFTHAGWKKASMEISREYFLKSLLLSAIKTHTHTKVHIYQVCQIKPCVLTGEYTLYQTRPDLLGVIWMHSWFEGTWKIYTRDRGSVSGDAVQLGHVFITLHSTHCMNFWGEGKGQKYQTILIKRWWCILSFRPQPWQLVDDRCCKLLTSHLKKQEHYQYSSSEKYTTFTWLWISVNMHAQLLDLIHLWP